MTTVEQVDGAELAPQISSEEAKALTEEVRRDTAALWTKVLTLYERGAHLALGYGSWGDYWSHEFGGSPARGDQLVRAGRVARAIGEAGLPLPANDSTARQLLPVLAHAPEKLSELWGRAVEQYEQPNTRQIRALVQPYRDRQMTNIRKRNMQSPESRSKAAHTRRARGAVQHALDDAIAAAETALAHVDDALATEPDRETIGEWHDMAKGLAQRFVRLTGKLR
jgi:hypothetical protein